MTRNNFAASVVTVSLTAICQGEKAMLLDANGKQLAVIDTLLAKQISPEMRLSIELDVPVEWNNKHNGWYAAACRMKGQYGNWRRGLSRSGWEKKAEIWAKSLMWRRNRKSPPRKTRFSRGVRPRNTEDWEAACISFRLRYASMIIKQKKRTEDPWLLWSETTYSNHRQRKDIHDQRRQRIPDAKGVTDNSKTTGIQVRFEWSRD